MKPRLRPRCRAAFGPAVLAVATVLILVSAVSGPVSGQSPSGWKRGPQRMDAPLGGHGGRSPARNDTAESGLRPPPLPGPSGFYSNLGLLDSISREAVIAIADSLALPLGSPVTLLASTPHEANWFVGNILGEILAERGYKVRILDWGTAAAAGDSSRPSPPAASPPTTPLPVNPNLSREGDQKDAQGESKPPPEPNPDKDVNTPADTTAAIPDSTQAKADSVQSGRDGGVPAETSPGDTIPGGEPPVALPEVPPRSAVAPPLEPAAAAALQALPAGEVLDLRVVEFGVSYTDVGRKLFFGPLRFTRVGGVYIQVSSLGEPEGELRQVLSAERHRVDRISGSQRSLAEGASYPFNIPQLKVPGLGRYIEPTVVVGIVSSLVYLFYANQSTK